MSKLSNSERRPDDLSAEDRELGMDCDMTRRDFINAMAAGTGAAGALPSCLSWPSSPCRLV